MGSLGQSWFYNRLYAGSFQGAHCHYTYCRFNIKTETSCDNDQCSSSNRGPPLASLTKAKKDNLLHNIEDIHSNSTLELVNDISEYIQM